MELLALAVEREARKCLLEIRVVRVGLMED
jgi:hypothetical protein